MTLQRFLASAVLVLPLALGLTACGKPLSSSYSPNMTALSPRLEPVFAKSKTVCFGRFVMDVPATAELVYGEAQVGLNIERYPDRAEKMQELVNDALAKTKEDDLGYKEEKIFHHSEKSYWGKVQDGPLPGQRTVFGVSQGMLYRIESFVPIGKDVFVFTTRADFADNAEARKLNDTVEQRLREVAQYAQALRPRREDEIPHEPGICIDGGFLPGIPPQGEEVQENITFGLRLKEFPGVHFSIRTQELTYPRSPNDYMEQRQKDAEREAIAEGKGDQYSRIKFFRRAPREFNGIKGFEIVARKPAIGREPETHDIYFECVGEPGNVLTPFMDAQLDTGVQGNKAGAQTPSLSDEEAMAVWDKLLGSIRVRPASGGHPPGKVSETAAPTTPLGDMQATGRICPESGWWQCSEEALPIKGGRKQFFRQGEAMPRVTLLGEPSVLERIKGRRPEYSKATVWKLMEHEHPMAPDTQAHEHEQPGASANIADAGDEPQGEVGDDAAARDSSA